VVLDLVHQPGSTPSIAESVGIARALSPLKFSLRRKMRLGTNSKFVVISDIDPELSLADEFQLKAQYPEAHISTGGRLFMPLLHENKLPWTMLTYENTMIRFHM
jgi:hypothetical protein